MKRDSDWARANRPGLSCDSFLEGPSFDRQGRLYVTDIPFGRVFRIDASGKWDLIAEYDGWPNGLKIHRDGRIVLADYKNGLMRLDPDTGKVTSLLQGPNSEHFKGVNDLVFGENGEIYFTDQGQTGMHDPSGRVYRLDPGGELRMLISNGPSPNGIAIAPSGNALFVAMTRANQIWRIPLHWSGAVNKVGVFANLHGGPGGPDGLAFDRDGNLFVAHAGAGFVWGLSQIGVPIACFKCSGSMPTNLAFGGPEMRSLFVTESETGAVLEMTAPVSGLPLFSHAGNTGA